MTSDLTKTQMVDLVTLVVPPGDCWTYPFSHGGQAYRAFLEDPDDPDSRKLLRVPSIAAVHFLSVGGCSLLEEHQAAPVEPVEPMTRMRHKDGHSFGWGGICHEADEHRVVTVPSRAVADAMDFGFKIVPDEPAPVEPKEASFLVGEAGHRMLDAGEWGVTHTALLGDPEAPPAAAAETASPGEKNEPKPYRAGKR